ncbi:MAG: PEP-CTERM sorting domain-containing protein [Gammaproteobacteria bacterium]|nr:PEP-CTERM sorting domain-containing protein [Gammaproteobacteria bacterium]
MKTLSSFLVIPMLAIGLFTSTHATASSNVAQGKTVTLTDGTFFTGGWGGGAVVDPMTVVDGVFLPKQTPWDQGAVWWDDHDGVANHIEIDLGGTFVIESFVVQADDNDAYNLEYRDLISGDWILAWAVPNYDDRGWGMLTRPDVNNDATVYTLASSITTDALRISGNMDSGDRYFSVSEVQAYGYAAEVPAPAALILFAAGLLGMSLTRRKAA